MSRRYEVVVSNIGTVYDGSDFATAHSTFLSYRDNSRNGYGRAASEAVTLMVDGEPSQEFTP